MGPDRYVAFQMAEVSIPRRLFADILRMIAELRPPPITSTASCVPMSRVQSKTRGKVRLDESKFGAIPAHQPKRAPGQGPKAGRVGIRLSKVQSHGRLWPWSGVHLGNVGSFQRCEQTAHQARNAQDQTLAASPAGHLNPNPDEPEPHFENCLNCLELSADGQIVNNINIVVPCQSLCRSTSATTAILVLRGSSRCRA